MSILSSTNSGKHKIEEELKNWCKNMHLNYELLVRNDDGTYDYLYNIDLDGYLLPRLPVKFNVVHGNFICRMNQLTTFEGFPRHVMGCLNVSDNPLLTSLKHFPDLVDGNVTVSRCGLTSLEGALRKVNGSFSCSSNFDLTSLKGGPEIVTGRYDCKKCCLTSLEGAPKEVGTSFDCSSNKITDVSAHPSKMLSFICNNNPVAKLDLDKSLKLKAIACFNCSLTTLEGCENVQRVIYCSFNKLVDLKGCPKSLDEEIYCNDNQLTTLEGAPEYVGGNFICGHNKLVTLEGGPKEVGWRYDCNNNSLTSLKGLPSIVNGELICSHNKLVTLEELESVQLKRGINVSFNSITSFRGLPEYVDGSLNCAHNKICSADGAPKIIRGDIMIESNSITLSELFKTGTNVRGECD